MGGGRGMYYFGEERGSIGSCFMVMNNEDIMLDLGLAFFVAREMNALSTILEYWQGHKKTHAMLLNTDEDMLHSLFQNRQVTPHQRLKMRSESHLFHSKSKQIPILAQSSIHIFALFNIKAEEHATRRKVILFRFRRRRPLDIVRPVSK